MAWKWMAALAAGLSMAVPAAAQAEDPMPALRILNWSEYIDEDDVPDGADEAAWKARPMEERSPTLREFARAAGCRIVYVEYDSPEQVVERVTSQPGYWDLVVVDNQGGATLLQSKKLRALDLSLVPNARHVAEEHRHCAWDRERLHSVPYLVGSVGIAWRKDAVKPIRRWADLLVAPDPALKGKIAVLDDSGSVVGCTLRALGHSGNCTDAKQLREAGRHLDALRTGGFIAAVTGDIEEVSAGLRSGRFLAAMLYSGDGLTAAESDPDRITFGIPEEGAFWFVDNFAIVADAPHPGLAHRFIDHVLKPEVHARLATKLKYQCPNREGARLVSPEVLGNPAVYPPEPLRSRMESYLLESLEVQNRFLLRLKQ